MVRAIEPYKLNGAWVFDDERVGLEKEPFVNGADAVIDRLVSGFVVPEKGFLLMFADHDFVGSSLRLVKRGSEDGGTWYHAHDFDMDGWLCPALLKYFSEPPEQIFVRAIDERDESRRMARA